MKFADYASRYDTIKFDRTDGVLEVRIHSRGGEAQWNITERGHHNELGLAFTDIARDTENKVVVLTGTGESFITGRDSNEQLPEDNLRDLWDRMQDEGISLLENFLTIPVPVIAAVNGPALIHSEIPVMADIVLAAEHAEFADQAHFVNGVVPGDGVQIVWPMLLGPNRGRHFLLTGEHLSAAEAQRLGVVAEVLPAAELLPRAHELAGQLAAKPRRVLRHTKTLLVRDLRRRLRDGIDLGLSAQGLAML